MKSPIKVNKCSKMIKDKEKKRMDEDKKDYLHKLVDMTTHHLVGRYTGNLFHFPRSEELIGAVHSRLSIRPNTRTNLLLPLTSHLPLF